MAKEWFHAMSLDDNEPKTKASRATTTAEKLQEVVEQDVSPSDPLTREHFGLSKCDSLEDETKLLGLYRGLLTILPVTPSTEAVQGWVRNTKLAGGIYHSYKNQGGQSRCFSWFEKNQQLPVTTMSGLVVLLFTVYATQ